jgi:type I restriction enzyme, S subunit
MNYKTVKLGDVCSFQNGFAFKSNLFRDEGSPIIRITNIQKSGISLNKIVYFNKNDYKFDLKKYEAHNGDLLIAMSGATTGKLGFNKTGKTFFINQRVGKFTPGSSLDKKYLYYILLSKIKENLAISKGAAQPNLSTEQIKNIKLFLPSLVEQKNIADKLDETFANIDKVIEITHSSLDESKKLLDNLLELYIQKNGQKTKKIILGDKNYLEIIDGDRGENYPKKSDLKSIGDCIFLNTKNVLKDGFNLEVCEFINKEKDSLLRKGKLKRHDVVVTTRGTLGNVGYFSEDILYNNIRINSGMVIFRAQKKLLNPSFLFKLLYSYGVKLQIKTKQKGAAQPHIPIQTLSKIEVEIPISLEVQTSIVLEIDKTRPFALKIIDTYEKKIQHLSSLKSAILLKELKLTSEAA